MAVLVLCRGLLSGLKIETNVIYKWGCMIFDGGLAEKQIGLNFLTWRLCNLCLD